MANFSIKTFVFALFLMLSASEALALCFVATTPLNFGAYDVFVTTPTDSAGTITVSCTVNTVVTVQIGISPTSGSFIRAMKRDASRPSELQCIQKRGGRAYGRRHRRHGPCNRGS